jgi:hypothetical protein
MESATHTVLPRNKHSAIGALHQYTQSRSTAPGTHKVSNLALTQSKVPQLDLPLAVVEDVGGLQVTMDGTLRVSLCGCVCMCVREAGRVGWGGGSASLSTAV